MANIPSHEAEDIIATLSSLNTTSPFVRSGVRPDPGDAERDIAYRYALSVCIRLVRGQDEIAARTANSAAEWCAAVLSEELIYLKQQLSEAQKKLSELS